MKIGSMAYLPDRGTYKQAIQSIQGQLDAFTAFHGDNEFGDANKFKGLGKGYLFTLDDDIVYPPTYVKDMIGAIERYERKAVITLHGKIIKNQPIRSFYASDFVNIRCLGSLSKDTQVDIPGTGVMAWHSDTIQFSLDDFPEKNMADIWVGKKCELLGIPRICLAHEEGYLKDIKNTGYSCFSSNKARDTLLTKSINSIKWTSK